SVPRLPRRKSARRSPELTGARTAREKKSVRRETPQMARVGYSFNNYSTLVRRKEGQSDLVLSVEDAPARAGVTAYKIVTNVTWWSSSSPRGGQPAWMVPVRWLTVPAIPQSPSSPARVESSP